MVAGSAHGQDPTVPSQAILDRVTGDSAEVVVGQLKPLPAIELRAMVMRNPHQGSAIIESDGQRRRLNLDRTMLQAVQQPSDSARLTKAVQLNGVEYTIENFSSRTIILSDGLRRILVQ